MVDDNENNIVNQYYYIIDEYDRKTLEIYYHVFKLKRQYR